MTFRTDLFDYVTGDAPIAAIIGTRFYWQVIRGATYPASRYLVVTRPRNTAHDGPIAVQTFDIQVDHFASDDADIDSLITAFDTILNGVRSSGDNIDGAMKTNETDLFQDSDELFRVTQEFRIHHKEP